MRNKRTKNWEIYYLYYTFAFDWDIHRFHILTYDDFIIYYQQKPWPYLFHWNWPFKIRIYKQHLHIKKYSNKKPKEMPTYERGEEAIKNNNNPPPKYQIINLVASEFRGSGCVRVPYLGAVKKVLSINFFSLVLEIQTWRATSAGHSKEVASGSVLLSLKIKKGC